MRISSSQEDRTSELQRVHPCPSRRGRQLQEMSAAKLRLGEVDLLMALELQDLESLLPSRLAVE